MLKKIIALSLSFLVISTLSLVTYKHISNQKKVAGVSTGSEQKQIKGIIIPHHDLAKQYIEESLDRIAQTQNPSNIVIIGPNHFQEGETRFISTDQLPGYSVSKDFVYKLQKAGLVTLNNETIQKEHSIAVPIQYLHNYFPNANYITLIAPRYFDKTQISQVAILLKAGLPNDTLFVAGVTFTHKKFLWEEMKKNK